MRMHVLMCFVCVCVCDVMCCMSAFVLCVSMCAYVCDASRRVRLFYVYVFVMCGVF